MGRLMIGDIKLKAPGEQVEEMLIDKFGSIKNFAREIGMHPRTIRQYLKEKRVGSDGFRVKLTNIFDKGISEIIVSEEEQLKEIVENVYDNIREYKDEEDMEVLKAVKKLCIENELNLQSLKMQRNIAMAYFYRNEADRGIGFMESTINRINIREYLIKWKSELGLMYFYQCKYTKSKELFDEVEELLTKVTKMDDKTLFLHYYRCGILKNNTGHHYSAQKLFEKALEYGNTSVEIGRSVMNIGISFKKQKKYKKAIEYLNKALCVFEDDSNKSTILNNLAELYKSLGEYDKALYYIKLALNHIDEEDFATRFIYYETYAQILMGKGEFKEAVDKLIELINKAEDKFIYRKFIIEGINTIIECGKRSNDKDMLKNIEEVILKVINKINGGCKIQWPLKE